MNFRNRFKLRVAIIRYCKEDQLFEFFECDDDGPCRPYFKMAGTRGWLTDKAIEILSNPELSTQEKMDRLYYHEVFAEDIKKWCMVVYAAPYYAFQGDNGKWGICTADGKCFMEAQCSQVDIQVDYIKTKREGSVQIYDLNKQSVTIPYGRYSYIDYFSRGFARVKEINGLWGIIDDKGQLVIPTEYDEVWSFVNRDDLYKTKLIKNKEEYYVSFSELSRVSSELESNPSASCYIEHKKRKEIDIEDSEYDDEDDSWYAMTDGAYGDRPDTFDNDYSFLGQ